MITSIQYLDTMEYTKDIDWLETYADAGILKKSLDFLNLTRRIRIWEFIGITELCLTRQLQITTGILHPHCGLLRC